MATITSPPPGAPPAAPAAPAPAPGAAAGATATAAVPHGLAAALAARLLALLLALRPPDGWIAAGLLTLNMIIVVWSVEVADWAPTPSLVLVMLLAVAAALLLSRLRFWAAILIPAGLALGAAVILWQMTAAAPDELRIHSAAVLLERLALWLAAARNEGISVDPLPFAVGLMTAAWLSGFLAGWVFFRHRNFWGVFALGAIGLLSNLTFLPDEAAVYLALYLFTGLLLVGWVQSVRARQRWDAQRRIYDGHLGILTATDTAAVAIIALLIAFLLPTGGQWSPANAVYSYTRAPLVQWEEDFNRLFAGLPARRPLPYRIWGDAMAFQGTINPTDTPVLQVNSPVPLYWKARSYARYTHEGWLSEDTQLKEPGWRPQYNAPDPHQERFNVTFEVIPNYDSRSLFAGGQVIGANRDVRIETFDSPRYVIDPYAAAGLAQLPPALQSAVAAVQNAVAADASAPDARIANAIAAAVPGVFVLESVTRADDGRLLNAVIGEIVPAEPDVLAVRAAGGPANSGVPYQLTASVSSATPTDLRSASAEYAPWLWSRYIRLPHDMPPRVAQLARQIAADANAQTPYDQAVAIETYLKNNLAYNLNIDPPPFGADGVDHFLFESRQGYSEYFGSAMTVLTRSIGIPARMTTGYTGGQIGPDGLYQVSDRHSHGWAEVYFPGYGWIPFEPTPGRQIPLALPPDAQPRPGLDAGASSATGELPCEIEEDCEDFESLLDNPAVPIPDAPVPGWQAIALTALPWAAGIAAAALLFAAAAIALWRWLLATPRDATAAYRRLRRLARLASLPPRPHQTPHQWGALLAAALPDQSSAIARIVNAYARRTYSGRPAPPSSSAATPVPIPVPNAASHSDATLVSNAAAISIPVPDTAAAPSDSASSIAATWPAVRLALIRQALRRRET